MLTTSRAESERGVLKSSRLGTGKQFQGSTANDPKYHAEEGSGPKPATTEWHLTGQGHAMVTARTLPQVTAAIARAQKRKKM
jgi:hypothetical protein